MLLQLRRNHCTVSNTSFSFTGESSLVIRIDAESRRSDVQSGLLTADFTFVARDATSNSAVRVPQLLVQGQSQQSEWQMVQDRVALRKLRSNATTHDHNSAIASALIEQGRLLMELPGPYKSGAMLSASTALENTFVTQPQTRNMSGRVFGGFLMKRAFELAFSTAYMFSGCRYGQCFELVDWYWKPPSNVCRPVLHAMGDVSFRRPVNVGDMVRLRSRVTHTKCCSSSSPPLVVVDITCNIIQPERVAMQVSNTFTFVFAFPMQTALKVVFPASPDEAAVAVRSQNFVLSVCNEQL